MPNMNSGTERPYAPLLEPYIIIPASTVRKINLLIANRMC